MDGLDSWTCPTAIVLLAGVHTLQLVAGSGQGVFVMLWTDSGALLWKPPQVLLQPAMHAALEALWSARLSWQQFAFLSCSHSWQLCPFHRSGLVKLFFL